MFLIRTDQMKIDRMAAMYTIQPIMRIDCGVKNVNQRERRPIKLYIEFSFIPYHSPPALINSIPIKSFMP